MRKSEHQEKILEYLNLGKTNKEIASLLGCDPTLVSYFKSKFNIPKVAPKYDLVDWEEVQKYYDDGHSIDRTCEQFKIGLMTFAKMVRKGFLKTRNYSQAQLIRTDVRTHTDSTKARLREAMLDRRANGYDWTFAHSKDNQSKMSYPETFWFEVIQNEFDDKDYIFNHPFGKFSLDFAWVNKKKVIEIDGEQHYTQEEQKIRDAEKDFLLKEQGWEILRIRWKRMFNDPKPVIKLAKEFIGV